MCGRFTLATPDDLLPGVFGVPAIPADLVPRYNIAPTQPVPVVANRPDRRVELFRWGLIPSWAKDARIGPRLINARAETVKDKPSFRVPLRRRRCLVLADGFFEWRKDGKRRIPHHFRLASGEPFSFAGLWDTWESPDQGTIHSCTIITTAANALVAEVHDRMPVILPTGAYDPWLAPTEANPTTLLPLLVPCPADVLVVHRVTDEVGKVAFDDPACIEPI